MKLTLITTLTVFILDQASKWAILQKMAQHPFALVDVAAPWLSFGLTKNTGFNFGVFSAYPAIIYTIALTVALAATVGLFAWSRKTRGPAAKIVAGCIAGGALGNALDRVIHGGVIDFINVSTPLFQNPYLFNLADMFVVGGVAIMIPMLNARDQRRPTVEVA